MAAFIHHQQRPLRSRLRHWQQVRTWARLIREAEALWHVDVRALRRLGAVELSQLIDEVPATHRRRVNRWLDSYSWQHACTVFPVRREMTSAEYQFLLNSSFCSISWLNVWGLSEIDVNQLITRL